MLVGPLTGVYKNMKAHVVALVFRCAPAIEARMAPAYACRLLDALTPGAPPAVRLHDGRDLL